jgi:hypothetical protein
MTRNWRLTSGRDAGGADHLGRSRISANTTRANSADLKLGSNSIFLFVVLLPIALVGCLVVSYAAFAPEPIQYQSSVEAYRLKSH